MIELIRFQVLIVRLLKFTIYNKRLKVSYICIQEMPLIPNDIYVEFWKHKKRKYKSWRKDRYKVLAIEKGHVILANDNGELHRIKIADVIVIRTKKINSCR